MPSSYTVNLGIEKIATGEQSGTWGDTTNVNFDIIDQAVNGAASVTLASAGTSGSPNTLAITDGATSDGRNKFIEFTDGGDLGATAYVQLTPNDAEKIVFIRNSLSGSRSVILFQGTYDAARDVVVPAGVDMVVKFQGGGTVSTVQNVMQRLQTETLSVTGNADVGAGLDVTGNITVTGTVDGRDVATDGTKLDTVETNADVTDTANVTAAGALMDSELTNIAAVKALNQGVATTNSPTFAGQTINGNITVTGTVDGRDVAADGTKLDGIEAGADVTDTANVTAAGALMDSELTNIAAVKALNQGVATSNSPSFAGLTVDTNTLYVDSPNNRVGINTTSPGTPLDVVGNSEFNGSLYISDYIIHIGDTDTYMQFHAANQWRVVTGGSERLEVTNGAVSVNNGADLNVDGGTLFVDASVNRVGIGTTSPGVTLDVVGSSEFNGIIYMSDRIAHIGDTDNYMQFHATDQWRVVTGNTERLEVNNSAVSVNGGADLNVDGGTLFVDASANEVGIGTTSPNGKLDVRGTVFFPNVNTTSFAGNGRISPTTGEVLRNTSSIRYKTDVEDAIDAISETIVYGSRPVWYRSLSEADPGEWSFWGFIAEELDEIDPRLVDYTEDENGGLIPDGVQYDRFVVHLVNVAQQQKARIDDLEARLAALEAKL